VASGRMYFHSASVLRLLDTARETSQPNDRPSHSDPSSYKPRERKMEVAVYDLTPGNNGYVFSSSALRFD